MLAPLVALLLGLVCNAASTWTTSFEARGGPRRGRGLTILLRDVLGIPLWVLGLAGAISCRAPQLLHPTADARLAAWCLIGAGGVPIAWALVHLRFRSMAPTVNDRLEVGGPYAWVRHPVYTGVLLQLPGIILLWSTAPVAFACALTLAWLPAQAWLEERDLERRMPGYAEYARRVPRFFPILPIGPI